MSGAHLESFSSTTQHLEEPCSFEGEYKIRPYANAWID
jgi:hypothetical protein